MPVKTIEHVVDNLFFRQFGSNANSYAFNDAKKPRVSSRSMLASRRKWPYGIDPARAAL